MPCPVCNHADEDHLPEMPDSFVPDWIRRRDARKPEYRFEIREGEALTSHDTQTRLPYRELSGPPRRLTPHPPR
jgi:hypothetical protein